VFGLVTSLCIRRGLFLFFRGNRHIRPIPTVVRWGTPQPLFLIPSSPVDRAT
jgi:hypothetical protein